MSSFVLLGGCADIFIVALPWVGFVPTSLVPILSPPGQRPVADRNRPSTYDHVSTCLRTRADSSASHSDSHLLAERPRAACCNRSRANTRRAAKSRRHCRLGEQYRHG